MSRQPPALKLTKFDLDLLRVLLRAEPAACSAHIICQTFGDDFRQDEVLWRLKGLMESRLVMRGTNPSMWQLTPLGRKMAVGEAATAPEGSPPDRSPSA
jgi:hypothetical protein